MNKSLIYNHIMKRIQASSLRQANKKAIQFQKKLGIWEHTIIDVKNCGDHVYEITLEKHEKLIDRAVFDIY